MSPAFEVRDLAKRYGRRGPAALRGVSLSGERGQLLGLLGPNGAGKTTTIKCLAGLVRPTSGLALLEGLPAARPAARRVLGYLPEAAAYPAHLTAAELLDREGRLLDLPRAERRGRTATLLDRVGLTDQVWSRRIGTYSKGERARLGLCLALMGDPPVLLLDEPTDGLDPVGRKAVRDLLRALRDEGRAVLLNSHLLSEVEACCDHVVIIKAGQVVAQGPTPELLAGAGGKVVYRARLAEPLDAAGLEALRARVPGATQAGAELTLPLEQVDALDPALDLLRARGGRLRELVAGQRLEDLFLDLVGSTSSTSATPPAASTPGAAASPPADPADEEAA
jgi:ABC-2 type transport system ATP-binding protein